MSSENLAEHRPRIIEFFLDAAEPLTKAKKDRHLSRLSLYLERFGIVMRSGDVAYCMMCLNSVCDTALGMNLYRNAITGARVASTCR